MVNKPQVYYLAPRLKVVPPRPEQQSLFPDVKISALPLASTPLIGPELLPIVQGGVTKKVSAAWLMNLAGSGTTQASSIRFNEPTSFFDTRQLVGLFNDPTDSWMYGLNRIREQTAAAHATSAESAFHIQTNPTGSTNNGPQSADYGLTISAIKKNWLTTTVTGEVNGLYSVVRNGGGVKADSAGFMADVAGAGASGFFAAMENNTSNLATPSGTVLSQVRTQIGVVNPRDDNYIGYFARMDTKDATASALATAFLAQEGTGKWRNFIDLQETSGISLFRVDRTSTTIRTPAGGASLAIDPAVAGQQSRIDLRDAGTMKYQIVKQTDNTFLLFDGANARTFYAYNQLVPSHTFSGIAAGTPITNGGTVGLGNFANNAVTNAANIYQAIYPGVTDYDTLQAVLEVPNGSTCVQFNAVAGYVKNDNPVSGVNRNAVALFGCAQATVDNSAVWGINTLLQDSVARGAGTGTGRKLFNEFDFNVMNPNTQVIGMSVGGNSLAQSSNAIGFVANILGTGFKWTAGFMTMDGACSSFGFNVGRANTTGSSNPSQLIGFGWTDGSGVAKSTTLNADSLGALNVGGSATAFGVPAGADYQRGGGVVGVGGMPISLQNATYVPIVGTNLPIGNNDLYTVPAGRKAAVFPISRAYNPSAGSITYYHQIKVSGVYYPICAPQTLATLASGVAANSNNVIVLNAGESLSINTTTTAGLNARMSAIEFDAADGRLATARILALASGNNTLLTVPAGKNVFPVGGNLLPGNVNVGGVAIANFSGGPLNYYFNEVPSGGSVASGNQLIPATAVANQATTVFGVSTLAAGDFVNVNASGAGGTAWITYYQLP